MNDFLHQSTHCVSPKKGQRRIYLEGFDYARAGFEKSQHIKVEINSKNVIITPSSAPTKHKVSGRVGVVSGLVKPVIDLCSKSLTDALGLEGELSATTYNQRIEISVHHETLAKIEREIRCRDELERGVLSVGSVCTGIGVSVAAGHQALESIGLKDQLKFVVDVEQKYLDVFQTTNPAMNPLTKIYKGLVEAMNMQGLPLVSKLSFSLPCTNHSPAGKSSKGIKSAEEDPTVSSLFGLMKVIESCNPAVIESENVIAARNSLTYQIIRSELVRKGYSLFETNLGADEGGCLEARERYYLIAISSGLADGFSLDDLQVTPRIHGSVSEILEHDEDVADVTWWPNGHFDRELADKKSKGLGFKPNFIEKNAQKVNVIRRQYTKHQISSPYYSEGSSHRLFTPKEVARLQRTPESLIKDVSRQVAFEGLGQGVSFYQPYNLTKHYVGFLIGKIKHVAPAINSTTPKKPTASGLGRRVAVKSNGLNPFIDGQLALTF
mgnify:CR=1 FL=1